MKKLLYCALILFAGLVSCKKETSIENGNTASGNFTAVINGTSWSAAGTKEAASILGGVITVTGISADNREISMTITDSVAGTYALSLSSASFGVYGDIDSSNLYAFSTNQGTDTSKAGGTVTITQIDPVGRTISGTFSFKVFREIDGQQKTITNGVFTKIPYVTALPATSSKDTLQATIDGKAWAAINIQKQAAQGSLVVIGASSDGTQSISLTFPTTATAGTYQLDNSNPSFLAVYILLSGSTPTGFIQSKGTLTITENNTGTSRIKGTFQFTGQDATGASTAKPSITSGVFSIYYGQ